MKYAGFFYLFTAENNNFKFVIVFYIKKKIKLKFIRYKFNGL